MYAKSRIENNLISKLVIWIKYLVAGKELVELERYRQAVSHAQRKVASEEALEALTYVRDFGEGHTSMLFKPTRLRKLAKKDVMTEWTPEEKRRERRQSPEYATSVLHRERAAV